MTTDRRLSTSAAHLRACDGQTEWGELRLCERRHECARFAVGERRRRFLTPAAVGAACPDFLPIPPADDDAR